jgi:hypothetical protein
MDAAHAHASALSGERARRLTAQFHNERTLIVANHESFLDGLLLALFLPVDATFVVHTEIARNPYLPGGCASFRIWRSIQPARSRSNSYAAWSKAAGLW